MELFTLVWSLLGSEHEEELKKMLSKKLIDRTVAPDLEKRLSDTIVELTKLLLISDRDYVRKDALEAIQSLIEQDGAGFLEYFDSACVQDLFNNKAYVNKMNLIALVMTYLHHLKKLDPNIQEEKAVYVTLRSEISQFIKNHGADMSVASAVGILYRTQAVCLPNSIPEQVKLCKHLLALLATYSAPDPSKLTAFRTNIKSIAGMVPAVYNHAVYKGLNNSQAIWLEVLKHTYAYISNTKERDGMDGLCYLIEVIPHQFTSIATKTILEEGSTLTGEDGLVAALSRLINYICIWPSPRISAWVMEILREVSKVSILRRVTEDSLEKLVKSLETPIHREQTSDIFFLLFYGYQHSPKVFAKVLPSLINVLKRLEGAVDMSARDIKDKLIEAASFMTELYPELGLASALTGSTPLSQHRKDVLSRRRWEDDFSTSLVPSPDHKHFVGLLNLGNTCYMNSVIQAIFMARRFSTSLLNQSSLSGQPVTRSLQTCLAYLKFSQRNIYSPNEFRRTANPPWFMEGRQHDCTEFLYYLLDTCAEEQKRPNPILSSIKHPELPIITEVTSFAEQIPGKKFEEDWGELGGGVDWTGSADSLCAQADSQENLDQIWRISQDNLQVEDAFLQDMGSTEDIQVEEEGEGDVVGELRGSKDNIVENSEHLSISRDNLNTSRSSLAEDDHMSRCSRGSKGSLGLSRWTTEENLSSNSGSREVLNMTGSREVLDMTGSRDLLNMTDSREVLNMTDSREVLNMTDSREVLNIDGVLDVSGSIELNISGLQNSSNSSRDVTAEIIEDPRQELNVARDGRVDDKLYDAYSNSTDSGIQSVGESNCSAQDKASEVQRAKMCVVDRFLKEEEDPVGLVKQFFMGEMEVAVTCHSCHNQSTRREHFNHLGLSFPSSPDLATISETKTTQTPEPANTIPGPLNTIPGPSNTIPGPSNTIPGPSNNIPGPSNIIPGPSNTIPGPSNILHGPSNTFPGPSNTIPGPSNTMPGPSGEALQPLPTSNSSIGKQSGAVNPTSAETPVMDNAGTSANHEKRNTPSDSVSNISVIDDSVRKEISETHGEDPHQAGLENSISQTSEKCNTSLDNHIHSEVKAKPNTETQNVDNSPDHPRQQKPNQDISVQSNHVSCDIVAGNCDEIPMEIDTSLEENNHPPDESKEVPGLVNGESNQEMEHTDTDKDDDKAEGRPQRSTSAPPPDTSRLSSSILDGLSKLSTPKPSDPTQSNLSIENLVDNYFESETLSGVNQYHCDNCGVKVDASRSQQIVMAPTYLFVTLNRFEYDRVLGRKKKVFTKLQYPHNLHINTKNTQDLINYKLQSMIVHSGYSLDSGHYYTWARDQDDESVWHVFNDSVVTPKNWSAFISQSQRLLRDTPYILMYEREGLEAEEENPALPRYLREEIDRDNTKYNREKQGTPSAGVGGGSYRPGPSLDRDEPDSGQGPSCGDGFGQFGGGRFVF